MRTMPLIILVLSGAALLLASCESDNSITNPSTEINLIANSSFEIHFSPSLFGWIVRTTDTADVHFVLDSPVGGGSYSVGLSNEWTFPGSIVYMISPPIGIHRYQLSAWAKAVRANSLPASGDMGLLFRRNGRDSVRKSYRFTDSTWTYASLLDTATTAANDTLIVWLRGDPGQQNSGYILFDLCKLLKLD